MTACYFQPLLSHFVALKWLCPVHLLLFICSEKWEGWVPQLGDLCVLPIAATTFIFSMNTGFTQSFALSLSFPCHSDLSHNLESWKFTWAVVQMCHRTSRFLRHRQAKHHFDTVREFNLKTMSASVASQLQVEKIILFLFLDAYFLMIGHDWNYCNGLKLYRPKPIHKH